MGPYCKFCNDRCFKPTVKGLRATCKKGIDFDLKCDRLKELENLNENEISVSLQNELDELAKEIELVRNQ